LHGLWSGIPIKSLGSDLLLPQLLQEKSGNAERVPKFFLFKSYDIGSSCSRLDVGLADTPTIGAIPVEQWRCYWILQRNFPLSLQTKGSRIVRLPSIEAIRMTSVPAQNVGS